MNVSELLKAATRRVVDPLFSRMAARAGYRIERNIPLALQRVALSQTADYVLANMGNSTVFKSGRELMKSAVKKCSQAEGLVLEFGVWKGASLKLLARLFDQPV